MAGIEAGVAELLERYLQELEREVHVESMLVFGSHARGQAREWSDIDVAIVSPAFRDVATALQVPARARVRISTEISPLAFSPEQWADDTRGGIVAEIRKHGITFYERRSEEDAEQARAQGKWIVEPRRQG